MKHTDFSVKTHGFAGHMAEPEDGADKAVIVIMGGEKSILPGIRIAERFAEFGICGLSVSLFGAEGLPDDPDRIPLELFENAVRFLAEKKDIKSVSTYGVSMGSLFAALIAEYIGGVENVIMVSPSHVPFEGTPDKKHMTGHSLVTWRGKELPFVNADFTKYKAMKYYRDGRTGYKVTGMWRSYRDAYEDKARETAADIHIEKLNARILLLAGTGDEMWPSDYSVRYLEKSLRENHYGKEYKAVLYEGAGHLLGMMPGRERNPVLYKIIPLIGIFYRRMKDNRRFCMEALKQSEREIVGWIK
ncbi:MAG: hypothetical protein NC427_02265 [Ruminococcus flavefaciens]|nr:hypothetical protein [Ruminococcus flavefaciens]